MEHSSLEAEVQDESRVQAVQDGCRWGRLQREEVTARTVFNSGDSPLRHLDERQHARRHLVLGQANLKH